MAKKRNCFLQRCVEVKASNGFQNSEQPKEVNWKSDVVWARVVAM